MLVKPFYRLITIVFPILLITFFVYHYHSDDAQALWQAVKDEELLKVSDHFTSSWPWKPPHAQDPSGPSQTEPSASKSADSEDEDTQAPGRTDGKVGLFTPPKTGPLVISPDNFTRVSSLTTQTEKYFEVVMGEYPVYNPNILPHPTLLDTWIVVAQQEKSKIDDRIFASLVCNAAFVNDRLQCSTPPTILPVAPTQGGKCEGDLTFFNFASGPHDQRVFMGPGGPYTVFGSNSRFCCFGMFIQDFRYLVDDYGPRATPDKQDVFADGVELQRPPPYGRVEKNWFVFWDAGGRLYIHHDLQPKRVFTHVSADGSVGEDLAPLAAANDGACMARFMPAVAGSLESVHQATNSLAITMCRRADPACQPNEGNTFVMTVFQHKTFYDFHSVYEPYVMLFKQTAPFEVHAISRKPLWINGRGRFTKATKAVAWEGRKRPQGHLEMMYVTSFSWKAPGQKYHGYLDDVLFLAFGIEDSRSGAIDVRAEDILVDMGLCKDAPGMPTAT